MEHELPKPDERTFESEGEVIEIGMRKTVESRDMVVKSLIRAVYRFRDAALIENGNFSCPISRSVIGIALLHEIGHPSGKSWGPWFRTLHSLRPCPTH